jgi:hypothetical protein
LRAKSNRAAFCEGLKLFSYALLLLFGSTTVSADLSMLESWLACRDGALTEESTAMSCFGHEIFAVGRVSKRRLTTSDCSTSSLAFETGKLLSNLLEILPHTTIIATYLILPPPPYGGRYLSNRLPVSTLFPAYFSP